MKLFFFLSTFFVITVIPCRLPIELQEKIVTYVCSSEVVAHIPLKKFKRSGGETLVFPSTSPIVFVRFNEMGNPYTQEQLRELKPNSCVFQHLQLWVSYHKFRIDNDLKHINTNTTNLSHVKKKKIIFFDGCADKDLVVLLIKQKDCINVSIRDLVDHSNVIQTYFSQKTLQPLSLCFHNNSELIEYSFIAQDPSDNTVSLHYHSLNYLFSEKFFTFKKQIIPIPLELAKIKKHEFIGEKTFLLLVANQLFFVVLDLVTTFKRQSFAGFDEIKKKRIEYNVISFAAYQDKRTPHGRARFIAVLVNYASEQKVFLIDLLDHSSKAYSIWCSDQNNSLYDRISLIGNILTLWVDDLKNSAALEIRLPINWMDGYLKSDLILKILCIMAESHGSMLKIINDFQKLSAIESPFVTETKTEDLGTLLLPKKRGNYGLPLYSKKALYSFFSKKVLYSFFKVFLAIGLLLYSGRYLIKNFYQR